MAQVFISDDTIVRAREMSGPVSVHLKCGTLQRHPDGTLTCTKGDPHAFYIDPYHPEPRRPHHHSLDGLRVRGFEVLLGNTSANDRVLIGPSWYRISEAIERNLI